MPHIPFPSLQRPRAGRASILLAVLLAAATLPTAASGQRGRFEETTDVVVVEVPIRVHQGGEPVRGLTAADFEILERGKKLPIVGFEVIDLATSTPEAAALPAAQVPIAGRRHFMMLFDLSFSDAAAVVRAREAARDLLAEGLHPADLVAVATLSQFKGAQLVLGFTSDREQIQYALENLGMRHPAQQVRDPLGIIAADLSDYRAGAEPGSTGGARNFAPDSGAELRSYLAEGERSVRKEIAKNEVLNLTTQMAQLASVLDAVQGSKHLVYLSEGFDSSLLLGTQDQARMQAMNTAAETGEIWNIDSNERLGDTAAQSQLQDMLDAFRRADCTIQAVDISGLAAGDDFKASRAGRQDGLFVMANETGGEFYRNYNNLGVAMEKMLKRTSVTYIVAVQPSKVKWDGKFHRLKVNLKNKLKGAQLIHRPGYYAPVPFSEQEPLQQRLSAAGLILGGAEGGAIESSVLAAPFAGSGEEAYVPVLIEIDGDSLIGPTKETVIPTEIYAYALDEEGNVLDFFSQAMGLDLDKVGPALRHSGVKFWGDFDLAPGDYTLRVLVRNRLSGATGLNIVSLSVPELGTSQSALYMPLFPEPPGKWLLVREAREGEPPAYPFYLRDQPFIPAARPVIRKGQAAEFCLMGYNLGESDVSVSSRLLAAGGSPVSGGEVALGERRATGTPGGEQLTLTFNPKRLAAGEYELEVTVRDSATGSERSSSIPIVVGG